MDGWFSCARLKQSEWANGWTEGAQLRCCPRKRAKDYRTAVSVMRMRFALRKNNPENPVQRLTKDKFGDSLKPIGLLVGDELHTGLVQGDRIRRVCQKYCASD